MSMGDPRILVVEDEEHLARGLKLNFELEGFHVEVAQTAREAGRALMSSSFNTILLDVQLPDIDGFTFCERLRESGNYTPVIMLTVKASAEDRVRGLEVGADDYLPKPFDFAELLARVRSQLRRSSWEQSTSSERPSNNVTLGAGRVDFETHKVTVAGQSVVLTKLELDLLRYFMTHPGRVLSRQELLENVWKLRNYPRTRTVDNFIVRLRRHFEPDPSNPRYFVSVRGAGYRFEPE